MDNERASRRDFLKRSGELLGGTWLAACFPAVLAAAEQARARHAGGHDWENLAPGEALALGMVADQIYPPDDTPGASELGAVHFMDLALGGFMASALPVIREGIADLDRRASMLGSGSRFAGLDSEAQQAIIQQVEGTPFFGTVHFLTLCGVFCVPEQGGNLDGGGWTQLGFDPRHVWQPPFGHYDAEYAREKGDAGD